MPYLVIPAYEPDAKLLKLLLELQNYHLFQIIVVNDGSAPQYNTIFQEASKYSTVLTHSQNRGKGRALKTAFFHIRKKGGLDIIITADADGQHTPEDIFRIYNDCQKNTSALIIGTRHFLGSVPLRSRFGNTITKYVFYFATGCFLADTQCGLRGFSSSLLPFLCDIKGEHYEYEMNVLLQGAKQFPIKYIPIETVYINDNASSHFHPVKDAFRIYKEIFKFAGSSLLCFFVDYIGYLLLLLIFSGISVNTRLILANIIARLGSGTLNYLLNRHYVFQDTRRITKTGGAYCLLAFGILTLNTSILLLLRQGGLENVYILKLLTELILFTLSWTVQKHFIFHKHISSS